MIQPVEIKKEIKSRPPLQRKGAEINYQGIEIFWKLRFKNAREVGGDDTRWDIYAWPEESIYPDVYIEVDKEKYPEFNIIHEDTFFWVRGKISKVTDEGLKVLISQAEILFKEKNEETKSINSSNTFINSQVHFGTGDNIGRDKNIKSKTISISNKKEWYEKPFGIIFVTVIAGLIIAWAVFYLHWN